MDDFTVRCPACGKPMVLDGETERGTCPSCGNEVWREEQQLGAPQITEEERAAMEENPDEALANYLAAGDFHRARLALDLGADLNATPGYKGVKDVPHIVSAADWNDTAVLEFLLEHGADPYAPVKLGAYEGEGTFLPGHSPGAFAEKCCFGDPQYGTKWVEVSAATLAAMHPDGRAAKLIADKSRKEEPGKGCYIATAVYGSYAAPEVRRLRRFRDEVLLQSAPGRLFVRVYYRLSPPLAKRLAGRGALNRFVKTLLNYWVGRLH